MPRYCSIVCDGRCEKYQPTKSGYVGAADKLFVCPVFKKFHWCSREVRKASHLTVVANLLVGEHLRTVGREHVSVASIQITRRRTVRVPSEILDRVRKPAEIFYASFGSGTKVEDRVICAVCRSVRRKNEPCEECATREWLCIWCHTVRANDKFACPSCKKFGVTKLKASEISIVYVETYDPAILN